MTATISPLVPCPSDPATPAVISSAALRIDPARISRYLGEVADRVVLPRWRRLGTDDVRVKSDRSLVTIADLEAEAMLIPILEGSLPGSIAIGEESVCRDPGILDALQGDSPVWIVDPVDGTSAFSRGEDNFGMLLSLAYRGEIVAAWAYFPVLGHLLVAQAGAGAFCDGLPACPCREAPDTLALVGRYNTKKLAPALLEATSGILDRHPGMNHDTHSSWEYRRLLSGEPGIYLTSHTTPWDTAGGYLLATEAGCAVNNIDETPYRVGDIAGTLLYVGQPEAWGQVRDTLFPEERGPTLPSFRP